MPISYCGCGAAIGQDPQGRWYKSTLTGKSYGTCSANKDSEHRPASQTER